MSVLIFFSSTIGILYYLGVIQVAVEKVGYVMEISLGTGAMESLHAAANIFLGWVGGKSEYFHRHEKCNISVNKWSIKVVSLNSPK